MPIARIRGSVEDKGTDWVIVAVGGIGVAASVPTSLADRLQVGDAIGLFTHLHVREDALTLFGFESREDLVLFEQLISVSGVGPRVALALLSSLDAPELAAAIIGGRADVLKKVQGVGQKTAERIVLDLRDKVTPLADAPAAEGRPDRASDIDQDVVAALMALGYTQPEASAASGSVDSDRSTPLEDRVRAALQAFSRP